MRVSVIGTGYLGAAHAVCLASIGHHVVGIDADRDRIRQLSRGQAPMREPDLPELLRAGLDAGRLTFDTDLGRAADHADVHFVCVGTPQRSDQPSADLSAVYDVVDTLAPLLRRPALLIGKSTVPVGTAASLLERIRDAGHDHVELAWNPEFLREAHAIEDSLRPDRIVIGTRSHDAERTLRQLYAPLIDGGIPVISTDLETAELAKASANVMLASRISVVNVLAEVCEAAGADIGDLIAILGSDRRIGSAFLHPGVGFGGGCLPKDTRAFVARGRELGIGDSLRLLSDVDDVNLHQRRRTIELATTLLGGEVRGRQVAIWGAAFKAGSDDVRDSPALDVASTLQRLGADVHVYDPAASSNARRASPEPTYHEDLEAGTRDAELILVLTEWDEFRRVDPMWLRDLVRHPRVLDGRLLLDADKWRAADWDFHALGRGDG